MLKILVHTGQHYDENMSDVFLKDLNIPQPPDYHLDIGSASYGQQNGRMLEEIEKIMLKERPNQVLAQWYTNSTLALALALAAVKISP